MEPGIWLTPLVLLPGVALLVVSTAARYTQLHRELHHLEGHLGPSSGQSARRLLRRGLLFRNALVGFYFSVSSFALSALSGGLATLWLPGLVWLVQVLTFLGVLGVLYGALQLTRESMLSLDIIQEHCDEIQGHS